jgi:protein-S-isoprenylcysteine O-methyltransferase Ste14
MKTNLKQLTAQIAGMFLVIGVVLFLAAGTVAWLAGWVFLISFFVFTVALSGWLLKHNPGLLTERMTGIGKANQKRWDKIFFALAQVIFVAWLIIMPLDAVRFGWSAMPGWLQVAGGIMLFGSYYLFFLTFRENAFLSPAVRIQSEREQTVISTGPYHYVRHPMYATALIFLAGTSLLLGSWYGLTLVALLVIAIAYRAVQEERTLQAELPGYEAYLAQVRYRLIPYLW